MKHHRFSAEQIVNKLRQADVLLSQGQTIAQASKALGVTEQIYYRWRKEFGGLKTEQAKRLKELERENARLKRLLADAEESKLDSRAISKSEIRYKLRQFSECARISLPMRAQNMFASRYDGEVQLSGPDRGRVSGRRMWKVSSISVGTTRPLGIARAH